MAIAAALEGGGVGGVGVENGWLSAMYCSESGESLQLVEEHDQTRRVRRGL